MNDHKGWYQRQKSVPHFDGVGVTQFVTFRLSDSLPKEVLERIEVELKVVKNNIEIERIRQMERYLDLGYGSCILRETPCAQIVQDSILYHDGKFFDVRAWVIMPNHLHLLARFEEGQSLPVGLQSLKSFTAHKLKELHPEMDSIWQQGYFDRFMRNDDHFINTQAYIHQNPVKAKLCKIEGDFVWSSAYDPTGS